VPSMFPGRGVQYHLGTIHTRDPVSIPSFSSPSPAPRPHQGSTTSRTVAGATWPSRTPTFSTPPWATASSGPTTWAAP
jgi:hypothetical protein